MTVDYIDHTDLRNYLIDHPPRNIGKTGKNYGWTGYMDGMSYNDLPDDMNVIYCGIDVFNRHFIAIKAMQLYRRIWYEHIVVLFQRYTGDRGLIVNNGIGDNRVMDHQIYSMVESLVRYGSTGDGTIKLFKPKIKFNDSYHDISFIIE